ncbi:hypothetical protein D3879_19705 [Pseudomonas cavernicola]|uniref:Uncharacterized protein n=1 Tax=Pseudomonas cavernicola TaxID=2320866 RepID=A0A418XD57_9PSED|nr:hypothetical protein [Pseudomonas cavernicola]RJG10253.1 hypothetical protein D3879_19705 [Pseudomonas cavernicola]
METQELELRQDSAMVLRAQVLHQRKLLKASQIEYKETKELLSSLQQTLDFELARLKDLESGRGALLGSEGAIKIYEFWIDLPGYSGPIKDAKAKLTQHGSLQQVSDVSSKQKSGLGGGIVGGVLLGPVGAAAGVLATRKNEVKTQIREIDTRQLEFEVAGPGYAWSFVAEIKLEENLRKLRDAINARGSRNESVTEFLRQQGEIVKKIRNQAANVNSALKEKESMVSQKTLAYEEVWLEYSSARLPLLAELKFKWQCTSTPLRVFAILLGPILLAIWAGLAIYSSTLTDPALLTYSLLFGAVHSVALAGGFIYYLFRCRL